MRKQGRRSVTAQLISNFVVATKYNPSNFLIQTFKSLTILCDCAARFVSELAGNPEERFAHIEAKIILKLFLI